jgi:deoxyadenosine/deoxycytidine kinase
MTDCRFIVFEGLIGTGKTTIAAALAQLMGARLVLEQFTDNPFLPLFYKQPDRYAFPVELFFLSERHKQLQETFSQTSLFEPLVLADYAPIKSLLFAHNNLVDEEYRLFQKLYQQLSVTFPEPDLVVYLHRPIDVVMRQIAHRGRDYETGITATYLHNIQQQYFSFLKATTVPILMVEAGNLDIRTPGRQAQLAALLQQPWPTGWHNVSLV